MTRRRNEVWFVAPVRNTMERHRKKAVILDRVWLNQLSTMVNASLNAAGTIASILARNSARCLSACFNSCFPRLWSKHMRGKQRLPGRTLVCNIQRITSKLRQLQLEFRQLPLLFHSSGIVQSMTHQLELETSQPELQLDFRQLLPALVQLETSSTLVQLR
eukprot:CAMPEP_0175927932 /NCGR_PEP_ID=MMETSP0108-20121206/16984_1 /TAXON_ID=195067 ORGANISM="Goniomonas pacifica, Strain CCMP1869" /NCGR_SAMPLE_ID=MMETSP0108 /ASSEMBLY_ACC=CAM_ASM_000204 /LENGTH=160 /DNA_ID=CAMNT_0017251265 /DNA_START=205 /DNA_END=687 /DNA_ORIENTATION=-